MNWLKVISGEENTKDDENLNEIIVTQQHMQHIIDEELNQN